MLFRSRASNRPVRISTPRRPKRAGRSLFGKVITGSESPLRPASAQTPPNLSADPTPPLLSASQRRIIGGTLTLIALIAGAAAIVAAFLVLGRLLAFFSHVLWPLAAAGVLALILRPVVSALESRLHGRRLTAVVLLYGGFVLAAGVVFLLLTPPLVSQLLDFVAYLPELWRKAAAFIGDRYPGWITVLREHLSRPEVQIGRAHV